LSYVWPAREYLRAGPYFLYYLEASLPSILLRAILDMFSNIDRIIFIQYCMCGF